MTEMLTRPVRTEARTGTVEILDGRSWTPVCPFEELTPGRGVAVLSAAGHQVAVFRDRAGALYAVDNRDPFSGAYVLSRGIVGSRDGVPTVASPMYKHVFDLRDGRCLDGGDRALPTYPVRVEDGVVEVAVRAHDPGRAVT
jgi:nitrite reductase (NADH) small subunit